MFNVPFLSYKEFTSLSHLFRQYHRHPLNVTLHLFTTPMGLFGALCLLQAATNSSISLYLSIIYQFSLLSYVPMNIWLLNAIGVALIAACASYFQTTIFVSCLFLAASYWGQDLAHFITGEPTFQSSYEKKANFLDLYREHVYYLLPLVIDSAIACKCVAAWLLWFVPLNKTVYAKTSPEESKYLDVIRKWVVGHNLPTDVTTHWWHHSLKDTVQNAFNAISYSPKIREAFQTLFPATIYDIEPLHGMDEIYVASLNSKFSSDAVFYESHVDGPYFFFPFVHVYRCIAAVTENQTIQTILPQIPSKAVVTRGEFIGFDFNREVHRIEKLDIPQTCPRITLKLHYCVFPKCLSWYGRFVGNLVTKYDIIARQSFLWTLRPTTIMQKIASFLIVYINTPVFAGINYFLGDWNIFYLLTMFLAGLYYSPNVWLVGTSFMHYCIYIATYYHRGEIAYATFKRNVMLYKGLAICNIVYYYYTHFEFTPLSLAIMAIGFGISGLAAEVLGVDRTYFGYELGICPPGRIVQKFPYGYIPHPMILGSILGLVGINLMSSFRVEVPYLIPTHILLYTIHMLQEHFDIYSQKPRVFGGLPLIKAKSV